MKHLLLLFFFQANLTIHLIGQQQGWKSCIQFSSDGMTDQAICQESLNCHGSSRSVGHRHPREVSKTLSEGTAAALRVLFTVAKGPRSLLGAAKSPPSAPAQPTERAWEGGGSDGVAPPTWRAVTYQRVSLATAAATLGHKMAAPESIYNLLPRLQERPAKPPRYISTFRPSVKHETEKSKAQWKTMGPAKVAVPSPKNFLKKHSKEPKLPARKKEQDSKKLPALSVPRRTDHPVMGIQSKKNFINTNAVAAITGLPKKPQPIYVDRRQGDKYLLETSGLVPKYIKKKDYGITPKYVTRRTEEMKRAQKEHETHVLEYLKEKAMKQLSDEERENLLQGLKKNWEEVHHEFQCLSVEIDTIPKKLRKEKLESQMKQLEHDIDVIEKHKVIYIANE